jgi:hypothetical protein
VFTWTAVPERPEGHSETAPEPLPDFVPEGAAPAKEEEAPAKKEETKTETPTKDGETKTESTEAAADAKPADGPGACVAEDSCDAGTPKVHCGAEKVAAGILSAIALASMM